MQHLKKDFDFLLLSYPRSGSNWVRYCLEFLTKRPTVGPDNTITPLNQPFGSRLELGVNLDQNYLLYRTHNLIKVKKPMILLIRNYKECVLRGFCMSKNLNTSKALGVAKSHSPIFERNLRTFNNWSEDKIVVYYEDLILNPEDTLKGILSFVGYGEEHLSDFLKNLEQHRAASLNEYSISQGGCGTSGDKSTFNFYSNQFDKSFLCEIDKIFEKIEFFSDHLERYKEI